MVTNNLLNDAQTKCYSLTKSSLLFKNEETYELQIRKGSFSNSLVDEQVEETFKHLQLLAKNKLGHNTDRFSKSERP